MFPVVRVGVVLVVRCSVKVSGVIMLSCEAAWTRRDLEGPPWVLTLLAGPTPVSLPWFTGRAPLRALIETSQPT